MKIYIKIDISIFIEGSAWKLQYRADQIYLSAAIDFLGAISFFYSFIWKCNDLCLTAQCTETLNIN